MNKFEILAPSGAWEQLKAAVICGANAVYLGAGNFNARRNAQNFTNEDLKGAVNYCHLRDVKVYVTLNTLIFDREYGELYETVEAIAQSGADAVIVQDFAVYDAVKKICPELPLHASTQMAVHNVSGALLLESLGFTRIVLARELSLSEISEIRKNVSAELEVFVHGAHCMSASGNCYLSAMLGERSGNRGLCAQGCRLNWKSAHGREFALSLKDMSYLDSINDLKDVGIDSFKIEGRMKRPEYVAAAVTSLKNAIDGKEYDKNALRSVFSRNGFTDGYLKGKRDLDMFGYRDKEDVTSAASVLKDLRNLYSEDIHPTKADMILTLEKEKPATLQFTAKNKTVTVFGQIPESPEKAPLSKEIAFRNLSKLGNTPFVAGKLIFNNTDSLTLSASAINALRRDAVEKAEEELTKNTYKIYSQKHAFSSPHRTLQTTKPRVRFECLSQYSDIFEKCEFIILPISEILKNEDFARRNSSRIIAELPRLIYPDAENNLNGELKKLKELGITHGMTGNIGGIKILNDAEFTAHGDCGLNITNTDALNFYASLNLKDTALSFELTQKFLDNMGADIPRGAYVYGYLPLMLMRACPQKTSFGCENCKGITELTDRKGLKFPVICNNRVYSVLHNSVPMYIGDRNLPSLDFAILYFTVESQKECAEIFKSFLKKENIEGKKTRGLFSRELL